MSVRDGGDELFCGYSRYRFLSKLSNIIGSKHQIISGLLSAGLPLNARILDLVQSILGCSTGKKTLMRLANFLMAKSPSEKYGMLVALTDYLPQLIKSPPHDHSDVFLNSAAAGDYDDLLHSINMLDASNYLTFGVLRKVDRAAMLCSLETRAPFLSPGVVEAALSIPQDWKIEKGTGKAILKDVLAMHIPREEVLRPKKGFGLPIGEWFRGPLRQTAIRILDPEKLHEQMVLDVQAVKEILQAHLAGKNYSQTLFALISFQIWYDRQLEGHNG